MNTKTMLLLALLLFCNFIAAQEIYSIKSGSISFFAGTPLEDIDAISTKVVSFFNIKTGEVALNTFNRNFKFKRDLMQEHFNENYMESEKYPKSEFKGKILNIEAFDFSKNGEYKVQIEGKLIHGVSKPRKIDAVITNNGLGIKVESKFVILLADHKIERPQIVWEKLAENVQTSLLLTYEPYKK